MCIFFSESEFENISFAKLFSAKIVHQIQNNSIFSQFLEENSTQINKKYLINYFWSDLKGIKFDIEEFVAHRLETNIFREKPEKIIISKRSDVEKMIVVENENQELEGSSEFSKDF